MSTGINIAPSSDLTVGTTAVTSGTDGRVFFQAGGVVQQDANFTFDNTLKRLALKAVSTGSGDIPFVIQNSAGTADIMQVAGNNTMTFLSSNGKIIFSQDTVGQGSVISLRRDFSNQEIIRLNGTNGGGITINPLNDGSVKSVAIGSVADGLSMWSTGLTSHNFQIKNSFHNLFHVVGDPNSAAATFRIGTAALNTNFFNVHGRNAGGTGLTTNPIFTINSSGTVGIGTEASTPGARLDVRAADGLSNAAFRVRNSVDTANIVQINGDGSQAWFDPANNAFTTIRSGTSTLIQWGNGSFSNIGIGYGHSITATDYRNILIGGGATITAGSGESIKLGTFGTSTGAGTINIGHSGNVNGSHTIKLGYHSGASTFGGTNSIHIGKTPSGNNITPDNVFMTYFDSQNTSTVIRSNGSLALFGQMNQLLGNGTGATGLTTFMGNGGNTLVVRNHTSVPSTNITDSFQQYSADITAGNAAPHFRTEVGDIIKLYKQSSAGITTVADLVTVLTNLGLLG